MRGMSEDELLDLNEAAKFLGVSDKLLLRILAEEDFPARKLGNKWRFSKSALIKWISEGNSRDYSSRNIVDGE